MQNEVGRLRKILREGREELFSRDARTAPCRSLLERNTALVDRIVGEIFDFSCRSADRQAPRTAHSGLAIAATGGYGRRELNPFSDIDIAFVPSEEEDPWVEAAVHVAFRLVMDVFLSFREIRVGYSYRPIGEVSTWDLATKTALLDLRHLCGNRELTDRLEANLRRHFPVLDLLLELQAQDRLQAGPNALSLYSVEPNLKEGPGSLRDLHRARWIFSLLLDASGEDLFGRLRQGGYLMDGEIASIAESAEWFWASRNWLHLAAGKRSDVIINNYQDRMASELGAASTQQWLARHYRHAETLALFRDTAVRATLQGPVDLGGIRLEGGALMFDRPVGKKAVLPAVRILQLSQRYGLPVGLADLRVIGEEKAEPADRSRLSSDESWVFLQILGERRGVAATLRTLVQFGLMDRFVDGFSELMRFVPPDPAHRYTVGDHSIRIVEHLEDLRDGRDPAGQRFSELLAACSHFDMLCLAALVHDAGKMAQGPDHAEAGMALTERVVERLQLPPEKREILGILVRHHLLLVRTARLQDLKSPAVIQQVADKSRTADALRHLYVFTYVDTRAVAERNWTSMDYRDLELLYGRVQDVLSGPEQAPASLEDRIVQIRRRLVSDGEGVDEEAIARHCDSMPASYVLNTPLEEIAFHLKLLERLESENVIVDVYNRPGEDFSELTVCTYDDPQPGMLARITGALYGCNVDIHRAQVFTMKRQRPVILDTLWVRSGPLPISEHRARKVTAVLRDILGGSETVDRFLKAAGKQPPGTLSVEGAEFRNDLSEEHTVVHIIARDLQGLLYLMTRALSRIGLHIHSAKVATWNARAENNFYVTTLAGTQIPERELEQWRRHLLNVLAGTAGD